MTDGGPLDDETRRTLFAVPEDHEVDLEQLEADAENADPTIVTPGNDPLDGDASIDLE